MAAPASRTSTRTRPAGERSVRTRPGLTPKAIVAAGRTVIERDGLDALSMRTVAAELGTAATSLYRHVADRDALLVGILEDVAIGMPVRVPGRTPELRLRRRWQHAHDYLAERSWVLHILIQGELIAESAFRFADACLADFLDAGLTPRKAFAAFIACWHLTIGEILDGHPLTPPREPSQRQRVVGRLDVEGLPALSAILTQVSGKRRHADIYPQVMRTLLAGLLADATR